MALDVFHTPSPKEPAVPTGTQLCYAGTVAPDGFLIEDGAAYSRKIFARLFAVIGTRYGAGDGSTTFNVPDKRGRSSVGAGQGPGLTNRIQGNRAGEENHANTDGENGPHTHTVSGFVPSTALQVLTTYGPGQVPGTPTTSSSGSGTGHNTMHPYEVDLWIIKT